jgi:hypothetical protein
MPPIQALNNNLSNYQDTDWSSGWIFVADVTSLTLSFLCDYNCTLTISYSIDQLENIIYQETSSIVSNVLLQFINKEVKTRYIKFDITGITVGSDLLTQGFYHV